MTTQPFSETVTDIGPPSRYTIRHECITPHHIGARADCAGEGRLAPRRVFGGVLTAGRDHPGRETMMAQGLRLPSVRARPCHRDCHSRRATGFNWPPFPA